MRFLRFPRAILFNFFAKKAKNITMTEGILTAEVYSFTKRVTSTVSIASKFLSEDDTVLIVDDFLANGQAAKGLLEIIGQAGAKVAGIGIVIEKSFQTGRRLLEETGVAVELVGERSPVEGGLIRPFGNQLNVLKPGVREHVDLIYLAKTNL